MSLHPAVHPPATVLFVDDEVRVVNLLRISFRDKYKVITATSGHEALEIMATVPVDVLVSDQRMPGIKQHSVSRHGVSNGGRQQNNDRRHSAPNNGKHSAPNGKRPASRPAQGKPNQGKKTGWAKPKKKK